MSMHLHGGAPEAKREIRDLCDLAARASSREARAEYLAEAVGIARGVRLFAPAEGRRMQEEVSQVIRGERDGRTWRPTGRA